MPPKDIEFNIIGDGNCAFNALAISIVEACLNPDGGMTPPLTGPLFQLQPNSFEYINYLWILDIIRMNNPSLELQSDGTLAERMTELMSKCQTDNHEFNFPVIQKIMANAQRELMKNVLIGNHPTHPLYEELRNTHRSSIIKNMTEMLDLLQKSSDIPRLLEPFDTFSPLQAILDELKAQNKSTQEIQDWCRTIGYNIYLKHSHATGVGGIGEMGVDVAPTEIAVMSGLLGLNSSYQFKTTETNATNSTIYPITQHGSKQLSNRLYKKRAHWDLAIQDDSPLALWKDIFDEQNTQYQATKHNKDHWDMEFVKHLRRFESEHRLVIGRLQHQYQGKYSQSSIQAQLNAGVSTEQILQEFLTQQRSKLSKNDLIYKAACLDCVINRIQDVQDNSVRRDMFSASLKKVSALFLSPMPSPVLDAQAATQSTQAATQSTQTLPQQSPAVSQHSVSAVHPFDGIFTINGEQFYFTNQNLQDAFTAFHQSSITSSADWEDFFEEWKLANPDVDLTLEDKSTIIAVSTIYKDGYQTLQSPTHSQLKDNWHLVQQLSDKITRVLQQRQQAEIARAATMEAAHISPNRSQQAALASSGQLLNPTSSRGLPQTNQLQQSAQVTPSQATPTQASPIAQTALDSTTTLPEGVSSQAFCQMVKQAIQIRHPVWTNLEVTETAVKLNGQARTTIHPVESSSKIVMTNVEIPPSTEDITIMADIIIASKSPNPKIRNGSAEDLVNLVETILSEDNEHVIQSIALSIKMAGRLNQKPALKQRYDAAINTLRERYQGPSELTVETRQRHSRL